MAFEPILKLLVQLESYCCRLSQAWNISTWQAMTGFFEPWLHGFASRVSISLSHGVMGLPTMISFL
jgi:hypothetical protein